MIAAIIIISILALFFWLGFTFLGFTLRALIWFGIQLPVAVFFWAIGIACCCTIILIPVGIFCFRLGGSILVPG